ncbi:MAG: GNAT family N-acetyltransferase [Halobacteria archaeon]|nr:GNAT family N-acetyltransferase [Halobacteria archaeon]
MEIGIRDARPEDREDVLGFASETWDGWDYIPEVWEDWLEEGDLLVGDVEGTVVGVIHLVGVSEDEAWIEGLRVDPDYRREGVATRLVEAAEERAREGGRQVIRCMVFGSNSVGHELFEDLGFGHVASLRHARAFGFPYSTSLERDENEEFADVVEGTEAHEEMGGLYVCDWRAASLGTSLEDVDFDPLYLRDEDGETVGACLPTGVRVNTTEEDDRDEVVMGFAWAKTRYITDLGLQMRTEARVEDADDVLAFVPDDSDYVNSLESAGYEVSDAVSVYEKLV